MQKIENEQNLEEIILNLKTRIEKLERGSGRIKFPKKASDPTDAENGEIWYNTTSETLKGKENGSIITFNTT